jgi:hypothetical protein
MMLTNSWQNKLLSDSLDETLKLQGVSDQKRAAIANFSVTLEPHQYIDDAGVEHIDVKQTLVGGFDAPSDNFVLDDEDHFKDHDLVGPLFIKSGRIKVNELGVDFLKEDWTDETLEDGLIYSIARSHTEKTNKDWVVHLVRWMVQCSGPMTLMSYFQVWGLTIKDGVKRSARRFRFTTKDRSEPIDVRLYYDLSEYLPSSPSSSD